MISNAYNRDCLEAMREFPDGYFDLAVVDPPYGIGIGHKTDKMMQVGDNRPFAGGKTNVHGGVQDNLITLKAPSKSALCKLNFIRRSTIAPRRTRNILGS